MQTKTDKFLKEWLNVTFESSTVKTKQFDSFSRKFKNVIKEQIEEDFDIMGYNVGHFYISGFLKSKKTPEAYVYFSTSDVRGAEGKWASNILIRTAEHEKDYTGGRNQNTKMSSFGEKARELAGIER